MAMLALLFSGKAPAKSSLAILWEMPCGTPSRNEKEYSSPVCLDDWGRRVKQVQCGKLAF